jgi:hypothetical protein
VRFPRLGQDLPWLMGVEVCGGVRCRCSRGVPGIWGSSGCSINGRKVGLNAHCPSKTGGVFAHLNFGKQFIRKAEMSGGWGFVLRCVCLMMRGL